MSRWNEDLVKRLRKKINNFKQHQMALEKQIKEVTEEEIGNFLFVAAGDDCIIKGMHYPDTAFIDDEIPMIWKTSEKNVYIAAWPQNQIRELLLEVELDNPQDVWDEKWNDVLQGLMVLSISKLDKAKEITE